MSKQIKGKVDLNRVSHSVRAAQAVLQYGVGAMVDFPDQTLVTAAPEYWSGDTGRIYDDRFAKALGVIILPYPPILRMRDFRNGIFVLSAESFSLCGNGLTSIEKVRIPRF